MYYSTIKTANYAKIKKLSSQEGIQRGKMCTRDLQPFRPIPIFDQFLLPTNSYFRPISISDQFLFQTNSYFRPIPISDQFLFQTNFYFWPIPIFNQFLFPTNSYFRPCRLWGWHIFKKARQVCGRLWKLKILFLVSTKEFQKLSSAASTVWKICISSLSLDADYDTWHTLEKEERPRGVQSLRRQRPCENAAVVKIQTRTFRMRLFDSWSFLKEQLLCIHCQHQWELF